MQKHTRIFLFVIGLALMASCAKEGPNGATGPAGPTGATGPAGPGYVGVIRGHVRLYDQYGSQVLSGLNTVSISLKNLQSTVADSAGRYLFDSVNTGAYFITAVNAGYAGTRVNNFAFLLDTLYKDISLSAIPSFTPISFSAIYDSVGLRDSLTLSFNSDSRARNCIVFVGNANTVSNATSNYLLSYVIPIPPFVTTVGFKIPAGALYNVGFLSGKLAYFAAYSYVVNDASVYEDYATGKNVYNAVNSIPAVDSAKVP